MNYGDIIEKEYNGKVIKTVMLAIVKVILVIMSLLSNLDTYFIKSIVKKIIITLVIMKIM